MSNKLPSPSCSAGKSGNLSISKSQPPKSKFGVSGSANNHPNSDDSSKESFLAAKSSTVVAVTKSSPNIGTGEFIDLDTEGGLIVIGSAEEIYRVKVHRYKEIKHYIKGEVLGRGKFGVVREFIDKRTLKRYAGKIIRRHILRKNPHLCHQVNKELAITYHFDHRNIMRVFDLYATSAKIYMFMEFCYGELTEFLNAYQRLPKCQAKDYFSQMIDGLNYLHSRGIIHRDIKPENILVTPDNTVKLADFGVCQEVSHFADADMVWGSDGTPLYHPPELFDPKILHYSGSKIDIWAAGVVLFRMITGSLPFFYRPETTREDIDEILTKNVTYPPVVRADVLLVDLCNRIFEKDFEKRITILSIRNHPWMQVDHNEIRNEPYRSFPSETRQSVDSYRGLTVLTRIFNKYYPPPSEERLVNLHEFEESCKVLPLARPSRHGHEERIKLVRKDRSKLNFI